LAAWYCLLTGSSDAVLLTALADGEAGCEVA
jgi:hypothetical protein